MKQNALVPAKPTSPALLSLLREQRAVCVGRYHGSNACAPFRTRLVKTCKCKKGEENRSSAQSICQPKCNDSDDEEKSIRRPSFHCQGQPWKWPGKRLSTGARRGAQSPCLQAGCGYVSVLSQKAHHVSNLSVHIPESIRVRWVVPGGRGSSSGGSAGVLTRSAEGASRSKAASAVAPRGEHRGGAKRHVSTRRSAGGALETTQVVHGDLVASLLAVTRGEVASIAATRRHATSATTLVVPCRLLSLCGLSSFGLDRLVSKGQREHQVLATTHLCPDFFQGLGSLVVLLGNPVGPA